MAGFKGAVPKSESLISFPKFNNGLWVDCFRGLYEVHPSGRVRSIYRGGKSGREIKPFPRGEYLAVKFCVDGVETKVPLHVLVARAFLPNPENKPTVNHKNGNKHDCDVDNLEWATHSEQMRHVYDNARSKTQILTKELVVEIRENPAKLTQKELAKAYGVSPSQISNVVTGRNWS